MARSLKPYKGQRASFQRRKFLVSAVAAQTDGKDVGHGACVCGQEEQCGST